MKKDNILKEIFKKVASENGVSSGIVEEVVDNYLSVIKKLMSSDVSPSVYVKNFGEFKPSVRILRKEITSKEKYPDKFSETPEQLENKREILDRRLIENQLNKKN